MRYSCISLHHTPGSGFIKSLYVTTTKRVMQQRVTSYSFHHAISKPLWFPQCGATTVIQVTLPSPWKFNNEPEPIPYPFFKGSKEVSETHTVRASTNPFCYLAVCSVTPRLVQYGSCNKKMQSSIFNRSLFPFHITNFHCSHTEENLNFRRNQEEKVKGIARG